MTGLGPVPGRGGRPLDQVRLLGVTARGRHGVLEHERRDGQEFAVDVVLHLDVRPAAASDEIAATVHYGELATAVADVVRGEPVDLIETLATRIAAVCLADPRVAAADVAVHKPQAPVPERFADVVVALRRVRADLLDLVPPAPVPAVLALGTNLGDRGEALASATRQIGATEGIRLRAASPVVETAPVGGPPDQPDYLNAVLLVDTVLSPRALLAAAHAVENAHGRERTVRWGPRTLDVDLVDCAGIVAADPDLTLPHPRAAQRAFVLAPWLAADPAARLPEGPVAELLAAAADREAVLPRPDIELPAAGT